jgi:hypothetical protein
MKISTSTRASIILFSLLLVYSACKKENFTKSVIGNFTGQATINQVPDMAITYTYPNCKVNITAINRKKVRVTVTLDPANPSLTQNSDEEMTGENTFGHSTGAPRQPTTQYDGKVIGDSLHFEIGTIGSSGPMYKFVFHGQKD